MAIIRAQKSKRFTIMYLKKVEQKIVDIDTKIASTAVLSKPAVSHTKNVFVKQCIINDTESSSNTAAVT